MAVFVFVSLCVGGCWYKCVGDCESISQVTVVLRKSPRGSERTGKKRSAAELLNHSLLV